MRCTRIVTQARVVSTSQPRARCTLNPDYGGADPNQGFLRFPCRSRSITHTPPSCPNANTRAQAASGGGGGGGGGGPSGGFSSALAAVTSPGSIGRPQPSSGGGFGASQGGFATVRWFVASTLELRCCLLAVPLQWHL